MKDELFDDELRNLIRFTDITKEKANTGAKTPPFRRPIPAPKPRVRDAEFEYIQCEVTQFDKLKSCGKSALFYGVLSLLVFYWQQTGQMAISAAFPCFIVFAMLIGLKIGRSFDKK